MSAEITLASVAVAVKGRGGLLGVLGVFCAFAAWGAIDDPLAYWSFDDAGSVLSNQVTSSPYHDASVLFGTPVSGVADGAAGLVGNALLLGGTCGIRLPYHQDNLGTSFTLSLWYWQQTNDTRQCVYQTRDNYDLTYEAQAGANSTFASYVGQEWAGNLTTGQKEWIHLVHTVATVGNTTTLSVYTNGVLKLTKAVSSNNVFNVNQVRGLHVGAYRSATGPADGRCFKGMIDELALWSRALSSNEVLAVYQRGAGGQKLEFTPVAQPVISLEGKQRSFSLQVAGGLPDGMFTSGWLLNAIQDPAYPYAVADTAGDVDTANGFVPDTAGNAAGPFNALIADVKWRVPLTAALRQLSQNDYTVETWFRTTVQMRGTLMGNHSDAAPNGVINLELYGTNNVRLYQRNGSAAITDMNLPVTNINTRNGLWHHLAGVRRDSTMSLYLDGKEVGSTNTPLGAYALAGDDFYLGRDQRTSVAFNGEQGHARMWTRALSASELAGLAAFGIPGFGAVTNTGLLAEYALYNPFYASRPDLYLSGYRISMTPPQLKQITMTNLTCEAVFRTTRKDFGILMGNWSNYVFSSMNLQLEGTNTVKFYLRNTAGATASLSLEPAGVNTRDGQWHRLAGVRRDNTMALYLDGRLVGSAGETLGAYLLGGDYYYLGRDGRNATDGVFVGDIAHARIWSRALSTNELAGLAASNAVPSDGLVAQYAPMLTNSLHTGGFLGSRFLRSFTTATNTATLVFTGLPRHKQVGVALLLAQLDSLDPNLENDHFEIRVDGAEVLSVGLGPNQGSEPQVKTNAFRLFGAAADAQLFKNTMTVGGTDLFFCGTAWADYKDHVYDLSSLAALQAVPHTGDTLVLELRGVQNMTGENEGFGIDQIELTVYPLRGTLISLR